jgi:hypothetical protein
MSSDDLLTSALDDPDFDEVTAAGKIKICCIDCVFADVLKTYPTMQVRG